MFLFIALIACSSARSTDTGEGTDDSATVANESESLDNPSTDTGDNAENETDDCSTKVEWTGGKPVVTLAHFTVPNVTVTSTCADAITTVSLKLSGGMWVSDLGDNRLGIGEVDVEPLGVFSGTLSESGTMETWVADIDNLDVDTENPVTIGFTIAAFTDPSLVLMSPFNDDTEDYVSFMASVMTVNGEVLTTDVTEIVVAPQG